MTESVSQEPVLEAIDIVKDKSGSQFDPDIAAAFVTVHESGQLAEYLASAAGRQMPQRELLDPGRPD